MVSYEDRIRVQLSSWESKLLRPPSLFERTSKKIQTRINEVIPNKVHATITSAVKGIVKSVLVGLEFVPKKPPRIGIKLQERDREAEELLSAYKKIAAAEGAGTGAGGFMLGLVDFPALIAIKMKFLFELAHIYGFSTRDVRERLFLLYVFQLAFSSGQKRRGIYAKIRQWDRVSLQWPDDASYLQTIDWEQFQQEYRDAIDLRKLLQLVPGIGAVVGAWANYGLLEDLGRTAMNAYRLRVLSGSYVD